MIPLYFRALETSRGRGLIQDQKAVEIVHSLDYDFSKFERAWRLHAEVVVRTEILDERVAEFLQRSPDAIVVNLGAGLDGRFQRLDNGQVVWFELDMPDSLGLRERYLPPSRRNPYLAGSMLVFDWMEKLGREPRQPLLLIAEGLFCYFDEADLRRLFTAIADRLPGAELLFQSVAPWIVGRQGAVAGLNQTRAALKWGVRHGGEVAKWDSRIGLIGEWYLVERHRERWGWLRYAGWIPPVGRMLREVWKITQVKFADQVA